MSTNYYLRHKPTYKQINELTDLIRSTKNGEHFEEVIDMVNKIYREPDEYDQSEDWGKLHIGKRSCGWKFQWCTNIIKKNVSYMKDDEYVSKYEYEYRYPLTKQGLTDFIMRDDIVVIDEYDEIQDKKEFLEMAFNWEPNGWDSLKYNAKYPDKYHYSFSKEQEIYKELGYMFCTGYQTDFFNDGVRWTIFNNFS